MTERVAVRWVVDHDDSLLARTQINDLHDLQRGVIVIHPRPGARRLGQDMLIALDKDHRGPGWPAGPERAWRLAGLWLAAEQVRHAVVYGAHRLADPDLQRLTSATKTAGATLWLVTHSAQQATGTSSTGLTELYQTCSTSPRSQANEPASARSAIICAAADFATFRATCWQLLDVAMTRAVEERLAEVMWTVQRWLVELSGAADRWGTGALVEQLLSGARDQDDAIVVMRATQLAFFDAGLLLSVNADAVCDAARLILNQAPTGPAIAALRRTMDPTLAALGALTLCTPLDSHRLAELRLKAITSHAVAVGDTVYDVPSGLRAAIRAQVVLRAQQHARPDDALFADRAGAPCTPRRLRDLATRNRQQTLAGSTVRHVDGRCGHHLGGLLTVHQLRREGREHERAFLLPSR